MTDKELIKEEIERLSDEYPMSRSLLKHLTKFINSLPKQPASKDRINECPYWEKYWGCATSPMNNCDSCPHAKWVEAKDEKIVSHGSDDLDEEIENYIKESLAIKFLTTDKEQIKADIRYIARHFAEWQRQKDQEKPASEDLEEASTE